MNETNAAHQRMLNLYKKHIANGNLEKANNIQINNLGRQKYERNKNKNDRVIKTYINAELNHMLRTEKPALIYIPKLPPVFGGGYDKAVNANITAWQRGYIKERLAFKCKLHGVEFQEVKSVSIGQECGICGQPGVKKGENFLCQSCGNNGRQCLLERNISLCGAARRKTSEKISTNKNTGTFTNAARSKRRVEKTSLWGGSSSVACRYAGFCLPNRSVY